MRILAVLTALSMCFIYSCGIVTQESLSRQSELYSSRIAFGWEKLGSFQIRGNAWLQGSNLVARGPFVLWGDAVDGLLRGDFYGPDGRPVVSVKGDSTGILIYMPRDEYAVFMPGGLRAGGGTVHVFDLIHLIRTGFPLVMEAWEITGSASVSGERIEWVFFVPDTADRMLLSFENGGIFPSECVWKTGEFAIEASSPHDEYNAWPWSWSTRINGNDVDLELTEINTSVVPWGGIWEIAIPIPVDTVDSAPFWQPESPPDRR